MRGAGRRVREALDSEEAQLAMTDPSLALRKYLFNPEQSDDIRKRDPRYRVRNTYRKGLRGLQDNLSVALLRVPAVRAAAQTYRNYRAVLAAVAASAAGAVADHPAWRRAAEVLQEAKMRVQDENIRREEMYFLMEQASSAEAAIVEPVFVFIVGTAFNFVYQVFSPTEPFWCVFLPVTIAWLRSTTPGKPPKLMNPNKPFPYPVIFGLLLSLPFQFGDVFFRRLACLDVFTQDVLLWVVGMPLLMAFLHVFCRGWDNRVYAQLETLARSLWGALLNRWYDVRLPGQKKTLR